ncbi:gustatory and odorant receptor 24 [Sitophilus oryzae]|uniref:Gustatory receptor n=1 Tax=Sitophilus oryzae TaxID=7048 RepID=A0A6J2XHW6_SITOR|nr:gustatory and odorant receptor 24 [Sitophilus oryzae]
MYDQTNAFNPRHFSIVDNGFSTNNKPKNVYLEGALPFYKTQGITKVAPTPDPYPYHHESEKPTIITAFHDGKSRIFESIKPMFLVLRTMGIFPVRQVSDTFDVPMIWIIYSVLILLLIIAYIGYLKFIKVKIIRSAEGRFEEAVIDYLFTVYLIPIVISPIALYEAKKQANVLTHMMAFEKIYNKISKKQLELNLKKKSLLLTLALPSFGVGIMVITHLTMANFSAFQVVPYCYINILTYIVGGAWYIYCDVIGKVATVVAEDFQQALKNIGSSTRVADYRSMWMMLSRIIRNVGNSFGYVLTFLCLYLFFVITLTIYGLFSQIQEGMGFKDIGLTITAVSAVTLLYFICDEAHYASACVRTYFQKKILLVELSWLNEDSQQEINMFLRATEMNPTDMCLCGFFDVNRNLFKSLLATMVTYLVVLLQFQISIPEDTADMVANNSTILPNKTATQ